MIVACLASSDQIFQIGRSRRCDGDANTCKAGRRGIESRRADPEHSLCLDNDRSKKLKKISTSCDAQTYTGRSYRRRKAIRCNNNK